MPRKPLPRPAGRPSRREKLLTVGALVLGAFLVFPAFHLASTLLGIALWAFAAWKVASFVPDGTGLPLFSRNELKDHRVKPARFARLAPLVLPLLPVLLFAFQRLQEKAVWGWALLALAGVVGVLRLLERIEPSFGSAPGDGPKGNFWPWISLAGVGAFFLFYRFGRIPSWMDNDCANCIADALYFFHGEAKTPFKTVWGDNPALPYMLYGLSFKLFGISFGSAALVTALLHLACLPLYLGFCRFFLPSGAAWLSALLFASSRWILFFVRTPRETSLLPLFEAAALFFFVRALEEGRKRDFAFFGISAVLLLQTYLPSRIILAFFLAALAVLALAHRDLLRRNLPRWGLALGLFGTFFSPMVLWYALHPEVVLARMKQISILNVLQEEGSLAPLWKGLSECFWAFNVRGGTDAHYNLPGVPLLDPLSGLCFWVGLAWCLSRSRRFPFLFLSAGFLAGFLGMVLADVPAHPMRAIASAPFVFLMAGLGADRLARALSSFWPTFRKVLYALALGSVLVSALAWNFNIYFERMPANRHFLDTNNRYEFLAGKSLAHYPKGWDIYMDFDGSMHTYVYTYKRAELRNFLPDFGLPIRRVPEKGAVLLLDGLGAVVEDLVAGIYPKASFRRIPYDGGGQALWLWEMTPQDLREGATKRFPPPGQGLWLQPSGGTEKGPGARWWPALFGIHKWVKTWALKYPLYRTSFTLTEGRPLRFHVRGKLRVWVDGKEREGLTAEWQARDLLLKDLPARPTIQVEYSPDKDAYGLDLFWEEGDRFVPIPSGAYRSQPPPNASAGPKGVEPENAFLMMPDW